MELHYAELARLAGRRRFGDVAFSALPDAPIRPVRRKRRLRRRPQ
jgi:hypothetical protein